MPSIFDGIFPALASTLLGPAGMGTTCIIKKVNAGYEMLTGEEVDQPPVNITVPCTPPQGFPMKLGWGTSIQLGDIQLYVSAPDLGFQPDNTYSVVVGGIEYRIVQVGSVSSGDVDVLYELQLRR